MAINSVQVSPSASALPSSMEVSVGLQGNCQASWLTMVLVLDLPSLPPPLTNIDLGYVLDPCLWLVTSGFPHVHPNICMLTSSVPWPSFIDFGLTHPPLHPALLGWNSLLQQQQEAQCPASEFLLIRNPSWGTVFKAVTRNPGPFPFVSHNDWSLNVWKIDLHLVTIPWQHSAFHSKTKHGGFPVVHWLRIHLAMHETSLVWEDPTCLGATRPVSHNYWACMSGAHASPQERPLQWEACALQLESSPCSLQLEKACTQQQRHRAVNK